MGVPIEIAQAAASPGWWPVIAALDPDEFRADDRRRTLVRVLPVARAQWDPDERYLAAAAATLQAGGRLEQGNQVTLGRLGDAASVVMPPQDLAELGSLNRALERRGVPWRFGGPIVREQLSDSGSLLRRRQGQPPAPPLVCRRRGTRDRGDGRRRSVDCPGG